jgi:hypothetical protein
MSLLDEAQVLQAEAHDLLGQLALDTAFPWSPQVIGSALSGLMVLRDLDIMFDAPDATAADVLEGIGRLAKRVDLRTVDFRDERDDRRPTRAITDERLYAVLHTDTWKIDLTFWLHVVDRPHVRHAIRLSEVTGAQRLAILELKQERRDIDSTEIYDAVLRHGVRTPAELDAHLVASY